jgi:hypothetical protein
MGHRKCGGWAIENVGSTLSERPARETEATGEVGSVWNGAAFLTRRLDPLKREVAWVRGRNLVPARLLDAFSRHVTLTMTACPFRL